MSADTIIILNGTIYEKPGTKEKAVETLLALSEKEHYVCTAVHIMYVSKNKPTDAPRELCFTEHTAVKMSKITKEDARAYADTGIPL